MTVRTTHEEELFERLHVRPSGPFEQDPNDPPTFNWIDPGPPEDVQHFLDAEWGCDIPAECSAHVNGKHRFIYQFERTGEPIAVCRCGAEKIV